LGEVVYSTFALEFSIALERLLAHGEHLLTGVPGDWRSLHGSLAFLMKKRRRTPTESAPMH
jgi:hypothetical protein